MNDLLNVEQGIFAREEIIAEGPFNAVPGRLTEIKYVFFAQAGEVWRIKAMILLKRSVAATKSESGWNETLERMEGSLLRSKTGKPLIKRLFYWQKLQNLIVPFRQMLILQPYIIPGAISKKAAFFFSNRACLLSRIAFVQITAF